MKLNRLQASFGNLNNRQLHLNSGLNIIQARNESGKSTWCAFIRSVLYGLSPERQRIGFLPDKTRYQPWNGAPMEGSADLTYHGHDITITRSSAGRTPFGDFSATYTGTAEKVAWLTSENAGEKLTGVPFDVFSRSAFIGQAAMRVTPSAGLEKRMASLVTTGDENTSYSQTYERLKEKKNALKYNRSGAIPTAQAQLASVQKQLSSMTEKEYTTSVQRDEIRRLENRIAQLQREIAGCDMQQREALKNELTVAEAEAARLREKTKKLSASLPASGAMGSWQMLADAQSRTETLTELQEAADKAQAIADQKSGEKKHLEEKLCSHPFHGKDPARVAADTELAKKYETDFTVKKSSPMVGRILIFLLLLTIAGAAAYFVYPWGAVVAFVLICLGIFFCFLLKPKPRENKPLRDILHKYDMTSPEEMKKLLQSYQHLQKLFQEAETASLVASQSFTTAQQAVAQAAEKLNNTLRLLPSDSESTDGRVEELRARLGDFEQANKDLAEAQSKVQTLQQKIQMLPRESYDYLPPSESREGLQIKLRHAETQLTQLRQQYNMNMGQLHAMGDPTALKSEISTLTEQIATLEAQHNAIRIAMETMESAETEMRTRFSPMISDTAGKYMTRMTNGRYDTLAFSTDFGATAKTVDDAAAHSSLSLSAGTADQMYLSLRLAISQLILDGEESCPLILDDALAFFDDDRAQDAMELLYDLSQQKQVILFTCHTRESYYMQGRPGVTILGEEDC